jgi:hypothetical protein
MDQGDERRPLRPRLIAADKLSVPIKGTHSRSEIEGACLAHGGFVDGTRASSGTYGCTNTSAGTSIGCTSNGHCTGYVPN